MNKELRPIPWIEKYRPDSLDKIISHQDILMSLKKFIEVGSLPHLLFFGPSGCGKTSTIKCCSRLIYGQYVNCMILMLNASKERGIETVRTTIKNFITNKNGIFLPPDANRIFKLVILDEIDSMTIEAQGMLRQTIEKNSKTTRFCLICNDIDKISPALQSRCAMYRFSQLSACDMKVRLTEIAKLENIKIDDSAIDAIIKISHGDMRCAINTLYHSSKTVSANAQITSDIIYLISGYTTPDIIKSLFDNLMSLSNARISLNKCTDKICNIIVDNNITIFNLLEELKNIILESKFNLDQQMYIIDNMAELEVYDSVNVDQKIIVMSLCSLFVLVANS